MIDRYTLTLLLGFAMFMLGVAWSIYSVFLMAHREDPGCLDPRNH